MNEISRDTHAIAKPVVGGLKQASDDDLRMLIDAAQGLLKERESARKQEALAQIRELAKASGLSVSVRSRKRRARKTQEVT